MSTLTELLSDIRANLPKEKFAYPAIPDFVDPTVSLLEKFIQSLSTTGATCYSVNSIAQVQDIVQQTLPEMPVICSATEEWEGNKSLSAIQHPRDLEDVDLGIIRAEFGVAEMGMVWLTENSLQVNSLGFLAQHLVVLLDPDALTANMHTAYKRIDFSASTYGCFVMGPSATADIGAHLVRGAQGPRSLQIFFLKAPTEA